MTSWVSETATEYTFAKGWGALIGIRHYAEHATFPPLNCAVNDAIALYALLTHPEFGNFDPSHMILLLDGDSQELRTSARVVLRRLGKMFGTEFRADIDIEISQKRLPPTRENILAEIRRVAENTSSADLLLVQCAAHGHASDGESYLVTPQTRQMVGTETAVPLDRIKREMESSSSAARLLILDLCYAGSAEPAKGRPDALFKGRDRVAILSSSSSSEQSFEDSELGHGVFTFYLLEGLTGKADKERKGYVTLSDLYQYAGEQVKAWIVRKLIVAPNQRPELNSFGLRYGKQIILSGIPGSAPSQLKVPKRSLRLLWITSLSLGLVAIIVIIVLVVFSRMFATPEQVLHYSLSVHRAGTQQSFDAPAGEINAMVFYQNDRVQLRVSSQNAGYLYLINEGSAPRSGLPDYRILFPSTSSNGGSAYVSAHQQMLLPEKSELEFDNSAGTEKFWLVWSKNLIPDIEPLRKLANRKDRGVVSDPKEIQNVQRFFTTHAVSPAKETLPAMKERVVSTQAPLLVHVLSLNHR